MEEMELGLSKGKKKTDDRKRGSGGQEVDSQEVEPLEQGLEVGPSLCIGITKPFQVSGAAHVQE